MGYRKWVMWWMEVGILWLFPISYFPFPISLILFYVLIPVPLLSR